MAQTQQVPQPLVKHELADHLRTEIMKGTLRPGESINEGRSATEFCVAQSSIREVSNNLRDECFVTKRSSGSDRVLHLFEDDFVSLYQLRGAIEGLATSLVATSEADLSPLQFAVSDMREAVAAGHREALLDCDLRFHLSLCEASASPILIEHARRILRSFFVFVGMRGTTSLHKPSLWGKDLQGHQRIIGPIAERQGEVARQYVWRAMEQFAKTTYDNWEGRVTHGR